MDKMSQNELQISSTVKLNNWLSFCRTLPQCMSNVGFDNVFGRSIVSKARVGLAVVSCKLGTERWGKNKHGKRVQSGTK